MVCQDILSAHRNQLKMKVYMVRYRAIENWQASIIIVTNENVQIDICE